MFGVCYYPEHWPQSQWDKMQNDGRPGFDLCAHWRICLVATGTQPGEYNFDWLDDAVDCLTNAGLKVVMGTPTATPPKWLIDQHPEILPVDPDTGRTRGFGSRRHYDFSSASICANHCALLRLWRNATATMMQWWAGRLITNSAAMIQPLVVRSLPGRDFKTGAVSATAI